MFTHSIKCIYHSRAQTSIPPRNRGNTFVRLPGRVMGQREGEGGLGGDMVFLLFSSPLFFFNWKYSCTLWRHCPDRL